VLVVDVGTVIEVYAEFSRSGGTYTPFPDPRSHRLALADLARPQVLARLQAIWSDPDSLNPARISAQVTREVADLLARLPPMLGLMATIIPLGPGLAALGQGQPALLASAITTAFDATVLGLAAGMVGLVLGKLRRRWYEELLEEMA
jgi:hypothetical protein